MAGSDAWKRIPLIFSARARAAASSGRIAWPLRWRSAAISICFCAGAFGIELHNRAIGNDRRNFGCADLDRLLHDQLHVFPFWNRLSQNDPAAQRRRFRFVQFSQSDFVVVKIGNFRSEFAPLSVEENKSSRRLAFAGRRARDEPRSRATRAPEGPSSPAKCRNDACGGCD